MGQRESLAPEQGYPPATRGQIIVWGLLAALPFGGMTWQALQYVVGLRMLGFDVWYVEDSRWGVWDPDSLHLVSAYDANVDYLAHQMERIGMGDRWVLRTPGPDMRCFGALDSAGLTRLYREVDAALNLCGSQDLHPDHELIRSRIYIETDPGRLQVDFARGEAKAVAVVQGHDELFTYAENIGADDCAIPTVGLNWRTTRPPVVLEWWVTDASEPVRPFTTITAWTHHTENDVVWEGQPWRWNKQAQWERVLDLPSRCDQPLELAIGPVDVDAVEENRIRDHGWSIAPGSQLREPLAYRDYLRKSRGEFTVAKEQYVVPRSGWFSDRSACYLAAGRPVVTQDTGFGRFIPTGQGLFEFVTLDDAAAAIEEINRDYRRHRDAAIEIARTHFGAETVLAELMSDVGL